MKIDELRKLDGQGLKKKLLDLRKSQLNLRFRKVAGEVQNTSEIKKNRRMIAQIKTLLHHRKIEEKGA